VPRISEFEQERRAGEGGIARNSFGRKFVGVVGKALSRRFAGDGAFHGSQESSEFTMGVPLGVVLQIYPVLHKGYSFEV
jgi:hypothetical protein